MIAHLPLIEIAVPVQGVPDRLTYHVPTEFSKLPPVGARVQVAVGRRTVIGVVTRNHDVRCAEEIKTKPILSILDQEPIVTKQQIELCEFVSRYYFAPLGETLRLCLPPDTARNVYKSYRLTKLAREQLKKQPHDVLNLFFPYKTLNLKQLKQKGISPALLNELEKQDLLTTEEPAKRVSKKVKEPDLLKTHSESSFTLTDEQQIAVDSLTNPDSKSKAFLLEGITGSGKTEVYIEAAKQALSQNKGVLVVVPEIALTPQLLHRFEKGLQTPIAVLHSGLTHASRRQSLSSLLNREIRVAIGARSCLFAPMPDLGLIVVDEEHDTSLKQDETPRYNGRDVALWRGKNENAQVILGSATPSLESRLNAERGKLTHLKLSKRALASSTLPSVQIIDLKSRSQHEMSKKKDRSSSDGQRLCILSLPLKEAISAALSNNEQVMLFLNRRGYASFSLCDSCGAILNCPHCSVSLTYYQNSERLRCHQCDYSSRPPNFCPECHEGPLLCLGLGTERVEKEVQLCFPEARIGRLDRDVARGAKQINSILEKMHSGELNVLIGTQMIAKGHDFRGVSLVGVILADTALAMPDFRAAERTFQVLTQVAGRAGRRENPGLVLIQTFNPNHPAITFAKNHDVDGFLKLETELRKEANQPPFVRSVLLRLEGANEKQTEELAQWAQSILRSSIEKMNLSEECHLLGPAPAPIARARGKSRWHLYLRTQNHQRRAELVSLLLQNEPFQKDLRATKTRLVIDIDPVQML